MSMPSGKCRRGTLWENLKGVRASVPSTTSESYQPASAAVLDDPGVQKLARLRRVKLDRLSPEEQAGFTEGLPVFVWGLDALTKGSRGGAFLFSGLPREGPEVLACRKPR